MEPPLSLSLSLCLPPIDEVSLGLVELIRFIDASVSLSLSRFAGTQIERGLRGIS